MKEIAHDSDFAGAPPAPHSLPAPRGLASPRGAWTLDPRVHHLNHGSYGAVPRIAQEAQAVLRTEMDASPMPWFAGLPARIAAARTAVAGFLGTSPDETALTLNASAGISAVFASLVLQEGSEIVVTDHGYGAVLMGVDRLARRWGAEVRRVHIPLDADAQTAHDLVLDALNERTGLIVLDHVTSPTARMMPVQSLAREARKRDIPILVDGAHAPGILAQPLIDLEADYWVGNLHKFPCAPRGAAALVVRGAAQRDIYPLIDSWGAPLSFPENFDNQGTLDLTSFLTAPVAFGLIAEEWGWDAAREYMTRLAAYGQSIVASALTEATGEDHLPLVGMPAPAMRLVRMPLLPGITPEQSIQRAELLQRLGVACIITRFGDVDYLRLSAHVYNTPDDYEYFAERCVPEVVSWTRSAARSATA